MGGTGGLLPHHHSKDYCYQYRSLVIDERHLGAHLILVPIHLYLIGIMNDSMYEWDILYLYIKHLIGIMNNVSGSYCCMVNEGVSVFEISKFCLFYWVTRDLK